MSDTSDAEVPELPNHGDGEEGSSMGCDNELLAVRLPDETAVAFRNLKDAKLLALDIGGSLAKIAYYSTVKKMRLAQGSKNSAPAPEEYEGARLHFVKFETRQIEKCLDFIRRTLINRREENLCRRIYVTGGGAYKFSDLIESKLKLQVVKMDEMKSIRVGADFLLNNIAQESFVYQTAGLGEEHPPPSFEFKTIPSSLYPYLLVTIGSGVSVMKVESESKFERIGGTATGGGTFWGLGRLLTGAKGFDELLELATKGDFRNADMLVKDIYGERQLEYHSLGLDPNLIASSFGKAIVGEVEMSDADMARSLLYMVTNDVCQIATLYAMLHDVSKIYFGGFFLRHHEVSLKSVSFSVRFWSKGKVQARFMRHEGYLGAIGAALQGCEQEATFHAEEYSWAENLYGSRSSFPVKASVVESGDEGSQDSSSMLEVTDHLEIDRFETQLGYCSLLRDRLKYTADTVDLTADEEARKYWLDCFEDSLEKFAERAVQSQNDRSDAAERATGFKEVFLSRLRDLRLRPHAHGSLTVRSILDMREQCLTEYEFIDPYLKQKKQENDAAFALLKGRLEALEAVEGDDSLHEQLAVGVLAGNVFDWGAKEVALLMEKGDGLKFEDALKLVRPRPWLVDDFDAWKLRMTTGKAHECAAVFIDNSGVDVILGVLPLVEHLLKRGTGVLLCANNRPVLNDVTHVELLAIVRRASKASRAIEEAFESGRLACVDSGQSSACLDLSRLDKALVEEMVQRRVDLIVLEGMGRAIHTNLHAKFKCESLKVAVIKNRWLAQRLGGQMFSVVFKYESAEEETD